MTYSYQNNAETLCKTCILPALQQHLMQAHDLPREFTFAKWATLMLENHPDDFSTYSDQTLQVLASRNSDHTYDIFVAILEAAQLPNCPYGDIGDTVSVIDYDCETDIDPDGVSCSQCGDQIISKLDADQLLDFCGNTLISEAFAALPRGIDQVFIDQLVSNASHSQAEFIGYGHGYDGDQATISVEDVVNALMQALVKYVPLSKSI